MIITFCTPDYKEEAKALEQSARRHGYNIEVIEKPEQGSWERNCAMKAEVVRDELKRHKHVLFLDADARIMGNIDYLLEPTKGIRLDILQPEEFNAGMFCQRYRYHAARHGGMWNSGILAVTRTRQTTKLMDKWVEQCNKSVGEWDQLGLQWAAKDFKGTVEAIPHEYRAGRNIIAHRSAFHAKWKQKGQKPKRKVLLIGSAPYAKDWWEQNGQKYLDAGFAVVAMNNAIGITGDDAHLWLTPNDYDGKLSASKNVPSNTPVYPRATNREGNWIASPEWCGTVSTVMLSCLYHLMNEALMDGCTLEVRVVGSDMIYDGDTTHFYGNSACDPLRFTDKQLKDAQVRVQRFYIQNQSAIFNAGGQSKTRLVFQNITL